MLKRSLSTLAVIFSFQVATLAGVLAATTIRDAHLVPYTVEGISIPASLSGVAGDAARGKEIAVDRRLGNCLSCHNMPIPEQADPGNVGPDLRGVGSRSNAGQLRLRVVNPKLINQSTIMPAYYRVTGLHQVSKDNVGKPMLSAQQIEDLVAYLVTLK